MLILKCIFLFNILLSQGVKSMELFTADMVADYFAYKKVKQICSITCRDANWLRELSLKIFHQQIYLSAVSPKAPWILIDQCLRQKYVSIGVLLDMDCENTVSVLEKSSEERHFDATHNWLIIEAQNIRTSEVKINQSETINFEEASKISVWTAYNITSLAYLNISIDAEITVAVGQYNFFSEFKFDLHDVFNFGKIQGGQLNVTSLGDWTDRRGLRIWLTDFKYQRRWDFHNLTLRAITVMLVRPKVFTPELLTGPEHTPGVAAITKISSMVIDLFRERHNFKFNYTIADRWVGSPKRNSTLAITNSMLWREQDISSSCVRIFPTWLEWMDAFFPQTTYVETKFYYQITTDGVGKFENKFLVPFSSGVWLCVLCACGVCGAALAAAARLEARPKAVQFALFTVIATVGQQAFVDGPDPASTTSISGQSRQIASLITGLSSLLLYNYYTSSVVSWLLSAPPQSIASLEELISSSLEVVFEDIGYTRSWLEIPGFYYSRNRSPNEDVLREKKAKSKHRTKPLLLPVDEGIELVRRGGYAYHTEPYSANMRIGRTFSQEDLCDLGSLQMMERTPVYVVGQRRSPYREFFVWSMLRAMERGHISCIRRRVHVTEPECAGSSPRALSLGGAAPAFLLVTCGWAASVLLLLLEIFVRRNCIRD